MGLARPALACSLLAIGCGRLGFDEQAPLPPGAVASVLDNVDDSTVEYVYGPVSGRGFVAFGDAVYEVSLPRATQISDTYARGADAPALLTLSEADRRLFFAAAVGDPARKLFAVDLTSKTMTTARDAQTDIVPGWDDEIQHLDYDDTDDVLYVSTRSNVFRWKPLEVSSAQPLVFGDRVTTIGFGGTIDLPLLFDGQLYFNASRGCSYGSCFEYGLFRIGADTMPLVASNALTDTRAADYHNDYPTDLIGDPISRKLYFSASTQGNGSARDVFMVGPSASLPVLAGDALTNLDKSDGFPDCAPKALDRSRGLLYAACRTPAMNRFELMRGDVTTIEAAAMDASAVISNLDADALEIVALFDDGTAIVRADFSASSELLRLTPSHTNTNKLTVADRAIDLAPGGNDVVISATSFRNHDVVAVVGETAPGQQRLYRLAATSTAVVGAGDFVSAVAPDGNDEPHDFIVDPTASDLYFTCRTDVDVYRVCRWTIGGPVVTTPLFQVNLTVSDDPRLLGFFGDYLIFVATNVNGGRSLYLYNPAAPHS